MKSLDEILDFAYRFEDAEANSLREYFQNLLFQLWLKGEGFSGKRPFGNSGWKYDIAQCLVAQNVLVGFTDGDYIPREEYHNLVLMMIAHCFGSEYVVLDEEEED